MTPTGAKANIVQLAFGIAQRHGPADQNSPTGDFEVKLRIGVHNNGNVPMTLSRITVRTVNPEGGAYSLYPRSYYFKKTVAPGTDAVVDFWARGYCWGRGPRDSEPVTIAGTAYFETPNGYYDLPFQRELSQYR